MTLARVILPVVAVFGLVVATVSGAVWFVGLSPVVFGLATLFALLMVLGVWRSWLKFVAAGSSNTRFVALADLALFSLMAASVVMVMLRDLGTW